MIFYFTFLLLFNSGIRSIILQLVDSKGDITNCRVVLLNGLVLQKILYCHDPLFEKAKSDGFGTIKISPSIDSYFEVEPDIVNASYQNRMFNLFRRLKMDFKIFFLLQCLS